MLPSKLRRKQKHDRSMIRRAKKSDQDSIGRLWYELLRMQGELDGRFAPSEDARTRWRNDFPAWLDRLSRRIFVAEVDGTVRGFVTAEQWAPAPIFDAKPGVYINELYVEEAHRREGIGTQLVEAVQNWAKEIGAQQVRAGVLVRNEDGAGFWKKLGGEAISQTFAISMEAGADEEETKKRTLGFQL